MNKKQKGTHLDAVKSAFLLSAIGAVDQHLLGKKTIIWSRLDNPQHARKVNATFENLFQEKLDALSHEDYLHVAEKSGDSHDKLIQKATQHFSKVVDKYGSELNYDALLSEVGKLDNLHAKHI